MSEQSKTTKPRVNPALYVLAATIGIVAFLSSAADAQEALPQYDVNIRCATRGEVPYVRACWKYEQESYDTLRMIWPRVPEPAKTFCLPKANNYPFANYRVLLECIGNWLDAHRMDDARPFHH